MRRNGISTMVASAAMAMMLGVAAPAAAQDAYAGAWLDTTSGHALWIGGSWDDFLTVWSDLADQDLRLVDLETDVRDGERVYSGVWRAGTDGYALWSGDTWDGFVDQWNTLAAQGLRLIDLETYVAGGTRLYAGVWRAGTDAYALWSGGTWSEFEQEWRRLSSAGLRLIDLETWEDGGVRRYAGVWRQGSDGHALWVGATWQSLLDQWDDLAGQGLRLIDLETYHVNQQRRWAGVWRESAAGYGLWVGVDAENFLSRWHDWAGDGLHLLDMERYPGCAAECANQVVAPDSYNYFVTGHEWYRWPVVSDAGGDWIRMSAVHFDATPFLRLPFSDPEVNRVGTWRYHNGGYHHAIDYSRPDVDTFALEAAAAGTVEFVGWDNWSGNTVVVSHTVDGVPDAFRTLYMHMRDGADHDCSLAWSQTIPTLSGQNLTDYEAHLNATGCTQDPGSRNLDTDHWGTNAQSIPVEAGDVVPAGGFLGWAGNTGPGGKRGLGGPNTHLHIFFARRDPTDNEYYFVDPYGIYAKPPCYPDTMGGITGGPCARYPNLWLRAARALLADNMEWGDLTEWSDVIPGRPPR